MAYTVIADGMCSHDGFFSLTLGHSSTAKGKPYIVSIAFSANILSPCYESAFCSSYVDVSRKRSAPLFRVACNWCILLWRYCMRPERTGSDDALFMRLVPTVLMFPWRIEHTWSPHLALFSCRTVVITCDAQKSCPLHGVYTHRFHQLHHNHF